MNQSQNDYLTLVERYQHLDNGQKALLRRVSSPEDLTSVAAFYQLINDTKFQLKQYENQISRLIYILPWIEHRSNGKSLGKILFEHEISEKRLFLVVRREIPDDLIQLRRLIQQIKPIAYANWEELGVLLFYWGKKSKNQLMRDFYLSSPIKNNPET